jgi:hypothetical protein
MIEDDSVRQFVRSVLLKANHFWDIPSSFQSDRPLDELIEGGNVLHTQRVTRIVKLMVDAEGREQYDVDLLLAAALIHDVTKGIEWAGTVIYDPMHPYTLDTFVKRVLEEDSEHINEAGRSSSLYLDDPGIARILRIARCHLGFWSPIPETYPIATPDWILHWADILASQLHVIIDGGDIQVGRWLFFESEIPEEAIPNQEPSASAT